MLRDNVKLTVAVLTLASGSLDVTAFMRLGGVFASVMRSNLVFVGIAAVNAEGALGEHCAVALVSYIAGVGIANAAAGTREGTSPVGDRRPNFILGGQFLVLLAYALWWAAAGAHPEGWSQLALLGAVALALGAQGVAARQLSGADVATTYLTGALANVVSSLSGRRRPSPEAVVALIALLVGAGAGAALIVELPTAAPFLAVAAIGAALVVVWHEEVSKRAVYTD